MKKEYVYAVVRITTSFALSLCIFLLQPNILYAGVGAIPGKFSVTPFGSASYSLPIELPPAVGGMTPKLSLVYSSRTRNGLLGVGWSVNGLSSISRCASTIAQDGEARGITLDRQDRYCLGKSRLVAVNGTYGISGTEYRTEKESFSRIVQTGGDCGGPCGFTVFTKDRRILEYGVTQDSLDTVPGGSAILRWSVSKVSDRSGNSIVFSYDKDDISDVQRVSSITYAGSASQLPAVEVVFLYEARPDARTRYRLGGRQTNTKRLKTISVRHALSGTNISEYRLAYSLNTSNNSSLLSTVTRCGFDASGVEDCLKPSIFSWARGLPEYLGWVSSPTSSIPPLPGSITGGTNVGGGVNDCKLLTQGDVNGDGRTDLICVFGFMLNGQAISNTDVQLSAGDKYGSWVTYQNTNAPGFNFINIDGCKPLSVGDVNGDGMTDIICPHSDGQTYVQLSEENRYTDWKVWSASSPPNGISSCKMTRADDVDGDNRTDLVCLQNNSTYVQLASDGGFTDWAQWNAGAFPNDMRKCRYLSTGDVDGDNLADIICALDTDNQGNSAQLTFVQRSLADRFNDWEIWYTSPGKSGFKLKNCNALLKSDVNGDNLQDILCAIGSDVLVQVSTGQGYMPWESWGIDSKLDTRSCAQLLSSDVDGDGMADLVCPNKEGGSTTTFVKRSTGTSYLGWQTFSQSQSIDLTNCARIFPVDANGDGLIDLACTFRLPNLKNTTYVQNLVKIERRVGIPERPLPTNRDVSKPDMIEQFRDGYGNVIVVDYAALTDPVVYSTNGACSWNPDLTNPGFVGPLPNPAPPSTSSGSGYPNRCINAPIYVVAGVRSSDGVGGLSAATYRYEDAGVNSLGRGFLGFEKILAENMQTGIVITTSYDQSLARDPYSNSAFAKTSFPIRVQKRQSDGKLISDTASTWQSLSKSGNGVYDVYIRQTKVTSYELDGSFKRVVTASNSRRDDYGNFKLIAKTTTSLDLGAFSRHFKKTENTYSNDPFQWIIGLPTRTTVTRTTPSGTSASRTSAFEYDSQTGLLIAEINEPDNIELKLRIDYQYNAFGNRISRTVTDSGSARYPFVMRRERDIYNYANLALDNTYTIVSANAVSHYEVTRVDARYGVTKQKTGPNGLVTVWEYDAFGRQLRQRNPDGTETRWDRAWCDATCPTNAIRTTTQASTGEPVVITYYDALGREVRTETTGFNGRIIAKDTNYDGLGHVSRQSRNYFVGDTVFWTRFTYDNLDRVIVTERPDGGNTETTYTGLKTIVRKYDNAGAYSQTTTRSVNGRGEEIQVIDANNQILTKSYDAFGNLIETLDGEGNRTVLEYDVLGRKTAIVDPDMGRWEYAYDAVGQQRFQKDARNQVVTENYDRIGRIIVRDEPEGRTTWLYDQGSIAKGKLVQVDATNFQQKLTYDSFGRLASESRLINGVLLDMALIYDSAGRISTRSYPNDFSVTYRYNTDGYLAQVINSADTTEVFWQADSSDADGNTTLFTLGNGQQTVRLYEPFSGRIKQISTGIGGSSDAQYMTYAYDALGNLTKREDVNLSLTETFQYDELNRLVASNIVGIGIKSYAYDGKGNITAKGMVNDYRYGENGAGTHAVSYARGQAYTYDGNGNMTKAGDRTQLWTSYNKPSAIYEIKDGWKVTVFNYGPDRARYFRYDFANSQFSSTLYFDGYYEEVNNGRGYKQYKYFIYVNGQVVAQHERYVNTSTSTVSSWTKYLHYDNLGSVNAVTYGNRNSSFVFILETMSFDAFGTRRRPNTWKDAGPGVMLSSWTTTRGFTGHEQIDNFSLIHMNGRVYDPALGRFLSADPFVQDTGDLQSFNRYSYVLNNPLAYTDPSGFFGDSTFSFFDNIEIDDNFNFVFNDPGFNFGDFGVTFNASESFSFNDNNFLDPFLFGNDSFYDTSIGVSSSFEDPSAITELGLERPLDGIVKFFNPGIDLADSFLEDPSAGLFATIGTVFEGRFKKITTAFKAFGSVTRSLFKPFGSKVTKSTLQANKAAGVAFERQVMGQLQKTQSGVVQQVTVKTQSGIRTRLDMIGRDTSGAIRCTECKASATAPLTRNQRLGFPEIQSGGGVVVGKGKPGFPGGTQIPPTRVDVIRP